MADNTELSAASGGDVLASDDIGGVKHQRVKISQGADGSATDVSSAAPLNVTLANTGANATAVKVDNSAVTQPVSHAALTELAAAIDTELQVDVVSSGLPTGAATSAKQDTQITAEQAIQTSVELIDDVVKAEDSASANGDKGVVVVAKRSDTPGATSGTDGDYEPLQVTGGRLATQATVSGTVTVDGSGVTQPVSNAGLTELAAAINSDKVDVNIASGNITGFATSAKQDTLQTAVDAIKTAVEILDNTVSGSETQVDVVAALPAGNNNIGDVDVASLPATPAGTNAIGKLLPPDIDVTTHTNYTKKYYTNAGAVTDGIIWSPAAGKRWHVVSLIINTSAAATVTLEDDKAGGDEVVMKLELAANSGVAYNFTEKYPLASGEDAADLLVTTSAGNIYITAVGYEV